MTDAPRIDAVFDFDALLSVEERGWQQKARAFAQERILPVIEEDFENAHFRRELIPELGAQGFLGMHLTGYGCAGAGAVSYGLVCLELEAADSGWRTFVSVQGSLAMSAIAKYGSEEQKQQWLPGMAAGELVGCFALTEPQGGSDPAAMTTTARRDHSTAQGPGAGSSTARSAGSVWRRWPTSPSSGRASTTRRSVMVARPCAGSWFRPRPRASRRRRSRRSCRCAPRCSATSRWTRCGFPPTRSCPEPAGLSGPFGCLNEARYGIVWGAMGAARSCLEAALGRSLTREVFGKPIGANQLTQAKLADMLVEVEKGILLALHLGRLKERGALTPAQISVGKLNSVREALAIAHEARTILGGDGITGEFPVMRHAANLESVRTYEGTDEIHQLVLGRALTGLNAF